MSYLHNIIDDDVHFIIDSSTRTVTTSAKKLYVTQYDHNSERFTFKIPRIVEGHDVMDCDRVLIDFNNMTTTRKESNLGEYIVTDMVAEDDYVLFTWLVSQDATKLVGSISFCVTFLCYDEDGNVVYEWGTDTCKLIIVLKKSRYSQEIVDKYPDVLEQIERNVLSASKEYVVDYAQPKGEYLTEHQSLEGYATEEYVQDAVKDIDLPEYTPGVTSWNDLTDKPFYEEGNVATIEWDGNIEGRDQALYDGIPVALYKISDLTPSYEDLLGGTVYDTLENDPIVICDDIINQHNEVALLGVSFAVFYKADVTVDLPAWPVVAPSTGIYGYAAEGNHLAKLTYSSIEIEQLDEKFIPDTIARVSDVQERTHWVEDPGVPEVEILPEVTKFFDWGEDDYYYIERYMGSTAHPIVVGESYVVSIDGVEYERVAEDDYRYGAIVGNKGVISGDTGGGKDRFLITAELGDGGVYVVCLYTDYAGYITLRIVKKGREPVYHTLDEKFIPDTIARVEDIPEVPEGGFGVTSWHDLTDRPFYEEDNRTIIEWDGDTEGRDRVLIDGNASNYYKISDLTPSYEELLGGFTDDINQSFARTIDRDNTTRIKNIGVSGVNFMVFYEANTTMSAFGFARVAPSTGIYAYRDDSSQFTKLTYGSIEIEQLDEKFIPDTIARVSDLPKVPEQVQPDLAQNDETAPDYVKGRTHWFEEGHRAVTDIVFAMSPDGAHMHISNNVLIDEPLSLGERYIVTIDGVHYSDLTAFDDEGFVTIGSPYANIVNELPFTVFMMGDTCKITMVTILDGDTHDVTITHERLPVYHPLDEKFIPDTIARKADAPLEIFLTSPGGKKFSITVTDDGTLTATETT